MRKQEKNVLQMTQKSKENSNQLISCQFFDTPFDRHWQDLILSVPLLQNYSFAQWMDLSGESK